MTISTLKKKSLVICCMHLFWLMPCFLSCQVDAAETKAYIKADDAFHEIEESVFDSGHLKNASRQIQQAHKLDPKEAEVYVAQSLLTLVAGFTKGNWYAKKTFVGGSVERALSLAQEAIALNPNSANAYAQLGRVYIIQGNFEQAESYLSQARKLDASNFYGWYYAGVLEEERGKLQESTEFFDEAEKHQKRKFQETLIKIHRKNLTCMNGDMVATEKGYLELIERDPSSPHQHGNYAEFLVSQKRYKEAILEYQKAIQLGPYPVAIQGLERAQQLQNATAKSKAKM